jgi:hypothetical protein
MEMKRKDVAGGWRHTRRNATRTVLRLNPGLREGKWHGTCRVATVIMLTVVIIMAVDVPVTPDSL